MPHKAFEHLQTNYCNNHFIVSSPVILIILLRKFALIGKEKHFYDTFEECVVLQLIIEQCE